MKIKFPDKKVIIEVISLCLILVVSIIFGFLDKTTEMGLSIVAGAIAFSLINLDLFTKLKALGFEAELKLEQMTAIVEKETEPFMPAENDSLIHGETKKSVPNISLINDSTTKLIKALRHQEYTWRYLSGLKKDTKLSEAEIQESLEWLMKNGYARQSLGQHGLIWSITDEGRYLSAVIDFKDVPR